MRSTRRNSIKKSTINKCANIKKRIAEFMLKKRRWRTVRQQWHVNQATYLTEYWGLWMIQSEQFEQLLFLSGELLHLSWDVITDCGYSPGPLQCKIKYITLISFFSHHIPNDLDQQSCCAKKA